MAYAIDPCAVTRYELEEEAGKPDSTVWLLRALTAREYSGITTAAMQAGDLAGAMLTVGPQSLELLRFGLCGWERFATSNGDPAPFTTAKGPYGERSVASDASLDRIPPAVRQKIAAAIFSTARLSEDDRRD